MAPHMHMPSGIAQEHAIPECKQALKRSNEALYEIDDSARREERVAELNTPQDNVLAHAAQLK